MAKRAFWVFLALVFSLYGCAQERQEEPEPFVWQIVDKGQPQTQGKEYHIATDSDHLPFEFKDANGKMTGIDILLLEAIAKEMGFIIKWEPMSLTALIASLDLETVQAGMAGIGMTAARKEKFGFTRPYYNLSVSVIVKKDSKLEGAEGLAGKKAAVLKGSIAESYAKEVCEKQGATLIYAQTGAELYTGLESGAYDAAFDETPAAQYRINKAKEAYKLINESAYMAQIAMAVPKGKTPELLKAFDDGLEKLMETGEYQRILDLFLSGGM